MSYSPKFSTVEVSDPQGKQPVKVTSNFENECHYCMAGRTTLAKMQKIDNPTILALRDGTRIPDARLEAPHHFTGEVVRNRGWVSNEEVETFIATGFTRQNVLEVLLGVATKGLSNYTNHIVHISLDGFMAGNEWTKPVVQAAAA